MSPGAPGGKRIALFPASFDPLTNGHLDLIHRTEQVFDEVVVAIATNVDKSGGTFTVDERLAILREVLGDEPRVRVESFSGLVVDFAEEIGATAIIRGLRAMSDFEYEFEMALMNRHLKPGIEILFMMTSLECLYVSSSRLKELAYFGADIDEFVPPVVAKRLRDKVRLR
jgi:pantetheine-phosphate adenylyltransferase